MDRKSEVFKHVLLDMVSAYKHIIFEKSAIKQKQEVWKTIHAKLIGTRLVKANRDWKGIRKQWYRLTHLARRSREQFLLGRIYDIPEFDKKLLTISGIPTTINEEQASCRLAVERLNMENQKEDNSSSSRDNLEIIEHKFPTEDVKSKEILDKMEVDYLNRKVNEQRFKLQQCKLLKRKYEICNMKDTTEREAFMKLL